MSCAFASRPLLHEHYPLDGPTVGLGSHMSSRLLCWKRFAGSRARSFLISQLFHEAVDKAVCGPRRAGAINMQACTDASVLFAAEHAQHGAITT